MFIASLKKTCQIAIGKNSRQPTASLRQQNGSRPPTDNAMSGKDLSDRFRVGSDPANLQTSHVFVHKTQPATKCSARMKFGKVFRPESASLTYGKCQRISQCHHHGGTGTRGKSVTIRLIHLTDGQHDVGTACKRAVFRSRYRNDRSTEGAKGGQNARDLFRFTASGENQQNVVRFHFSQIAMKGIGRIKEMGRRTRRRERGRNLLSYVSGFANTANNDRSLTMENPIDGLQKAGIKILRKFLNGKGFMIQNFFSKR
jgi:ribosomal protein L20